MNGNESGQKLNAREMTEEIDRMTNPIAEAEIQNEPKNEVVGRTREQMGAIGSAILASGHSESLVSGEQTAEQERNTERVEQMVAVENKLGEEQRLATAAPVMPEALIMPQVQTKVDKMMVKALGQLTNAEGNHPGRLDAKMNDLRRQYRVSWEAGR